MNEIQQLYFTLRKVGHFTAYALLFLTYVRAWWHLNFSRPKAILLALAVCLMVSAADETRQSFHPSRTGSPRDVVLDMSGGCVAAIIFFPFLRRQDQR